MFDNVLGQSAVTQLSRDIEEGRLAPAMLFEGPRASGKGTCALELARIISCENHDERAAWNCGCSACGRHRLLLHPDLQSLGSRNFSEEISASAAAFLREPHKASGYTFFIRSVRKLLSRFSPVLWEDEPKLSKINPVLSSLEEGLDELELLNRESRSPQESRSPSESLEKVVAAIIKNALKLESDGITDTIPIAQIRRIASWAHLLPSGRGKILLIENADRMQEGARNSLLKLLEEPPELVTLILTSSRPKTLLPTILSRLRPYRFAARDEETEKEVIRRVFRNENFPVSGRAENGTLVSAYLDSFLPVPAETLDRLAAFFAASAARKAALIIRGKTGELPPAIISLGKSCAQAAEEAGFGRPAAEQSEAVAAVLKGASDFGSRSFFTRFLRALLARVSESRKSGPQAVPFGELWRDCIARADNAVSIYNQSAVLALERLFTEASRGMAKLCGSS